MDQNSRKFYKIMGWSFIGAGSVFVLVLSLSQKPLAIGFILGFLIIPLIFIALGISWLVRIRKEEKLEKEAKLKGKKRICKIYELVNSKSAFINGLPTINIKLRFVDENEIIREYLSITNLDPKKCPYYRGLTVNAYEYQDSFIIDQKSIREEILPRENELMSEKPLDMSAFSERTTQKCRVCGALYPIVKGTANQCPYCGEYNQ